MGFVPKIELDTASEMCERLAASEEQKAELLSEAQELLAERETQLFISGRKRESPLPVVGVEVGDPEPTDTEERKLYVAAVAGFQHQFLGPKLLKMIADARGQFEEVGKDTFGFSQHEYDTFLKGTINGLWLIHEWGRSLVNEQLANQEEAREVTEAELAALKNNK